jgi:hypothetical protein
MAPQATPLHGSSTPAYVESGIILDVDIENYAVTASPQIGRRPQYGISFATPYQHHANGEGMYFMPEVGSLCWICFPSDGSRPFVIAWASPLDDTGGRRGSKKELNPGDIYLGTRDENFLILRRGGIVQIGGGPLCQRMFLPINNTIKDFCENFELHTLAGDLEWTVDLSEKTKDGSRPAGLHLKAREFAGDPEPIAYLEIGSHDAQPQTILSLTINSSGKKGWKKKISLEFRKDGTASWSFASDVDWTCTGKLTVKVTKDMEFTSLNGLATLRGKTALVETTKGAMNLSSADSVNIKATTFVGVGPQVMLGAGVSGADYPFMIATPALLAYLTAHVHLSTAPGTQTSPPVVAITPLTPADHISKTTFGK